MASIQDEFTQVFLTYEDVKTANPTWSDQMIEDYISLKRDLDTTANEANELVLQEGSTDPFTFSLLVKLQKQVGSGNFLTSDETGFTVDSTKLTVDMTEA